MIAKLPITSEFNPPDMVDPAAAKAAAAAIQNLSYMSITIVLHLLWNIVSICCVVGFNGDIVFGFEESIVQELYIKSISTL